MKNTTLNPYHDLKDISEVEPLSDSDNACLSEIREVLSRHNSLNRFGVSLLHAHFPVSEDEILVEICDLKSRRLTLKTPEENANPKG